MLPPRHISGNIHDTGVWLGVAGGHVFGLLKNAKKPYRCVFKLSPQAYAAGARNIIEIYGACDTIEIANLTLDGGRDGTESLGQERAQCAAIYAAGDYHHDKGPAGPKPKEIVIRDCVIQNGIGRGVVFYSVEPDNATLFRRSLVPQFTVVRPPERKTG